MSRSVQGVLLLLLLPWGAAPGAAPPEPGGDAPQDRIRVLQELAQKHLDAGSHERAREVYRQIAALDPQHPQAFLGVVLAAAREGNLEAVEAALQTASPEPGPGRPYGLGVLRFLQGRIDEARVLAQEALEGYLELGHGAGEAAARTLLGNAHLRQSRPDAAVVQYLEAAGILEDLGDRRGAVDLMDNIAAAELNRGAPHKALAAQERALRLRRQMGDTSGQARTWANLALTLRRLGRSEEALEAFQGALELHRRTGDRQAEARLLNNLGLLHLDLQRLEAAMEVFARARDIAAAVDDKRSVAHSLTNMALLRRRQGDRNAAETLYREALTLHQERGATLEAITVLNDLALLHEEEGAISEALAATEEALRIHRDRSDPVGEARQLAVMGDLHRRLGNQAAAVARLQEALELFRQEEERRGEAGVLESLAGAWMDVGDLATAKDALEGALRIRRALEDRRGETWVLDRQAVLLMRTGRFAAAEQLLATALQTAMELGDRILQAAVRNELGNLALLRGDMAGALQQHEESLSLSRTAADARGEIAALLNMGAAYQALGEPEAALRRSHEALERARESGYGDLEAMIESNIGLLRAQSGNLLEARRLQEASLETRRLLGDLRGVAHGAASLADTLRRLGQHQRAAELLQEALVRFREMGDRHGEALVLNDRGRLARETHDASASLSFHGQALELAESHGLAAETVLAHAGIARALEALGRTDGAAAAYGRALARAERIRAGLGSERFKSRYLQRVHPVFLDAIRLQLSLAAGGERDAVSRAFDLAERSRARSLLDLLSESQARMREKLPEAVLDEEQQMLGRLARASMIARETSVEPGRSRAMAELNEAEEALEVFLTKLRRLAPQYGEVFYPRPVVLGELVSGLLRQGEALLAYTLGPETSALWLIHEGKVDWLPLPGEAVVKAQVNDFLRSLADPARLLSSRASRSAGEVLARTLLPPDLPAAGRLILVPDGILYHVPFEALPLEDGLLVERHEVSYTPSASVLGTLRRRAPSRGAGLLCLAVPEIAGSDLALLPHSRKEIAAIKEALSPLPSDTLLGRSATASRLRSVELGNYRYLHFAAHALIDEVAPQRSGLLLPAVAGPGVEVLSAREIAGKSLDAELVVLSACSTARGQLLRGEGVVGLSHAFLYAGSRALVVSLWHVNDRSTASFMALFYSGLAAGRPPAAALREAKLEFIGADRPLHRQPGRWAPFILVGDPGEPVEPSSVPHD